MFLWEDADSVEPGVMRLGGRGIIHFLSVGSFFGHEAGIE